MLKGIKVVGMSTCLKRHNMKLAIYVGSHDGKCFCIYRIFRSITRALSIQKRSKFVKNEHARYTLEIWNLKNLERLITATSQARF